MSDRADIIVEIIQDIKGKLLSLNIDDGVKSDFVNRIDKFIELVDEIDETSSLNSRDEANYLVDQLEVIHDDVMDYLEEVTGMNKG